MEDSKSKRNSHHMRGWYDMRNTLSPAVQCLNHDDMNLTNKQRNCALTGQCSCALYWKCSGYWFHHADVIPNTDFFPSGFCSSLLYLSSDCILWSSILICSQLLHTFASRERIIKSVVFTWRPTEARLTCFCQLLYPDFSAQTLPLDMCFLFLQTVPFAACYVSSKIACDKEHALQSCNGPSCFLVEFLPFHNLFFQLPCSNKTWELIQLTCVSTVWRHCPTVRFFWSFSVLSTSSDDACRSSSKMLK